MKKAFSLMEVIVSVVILSFVMITLIQIKNENIFLVSKSNDKSTIEEYILLSIDFNDTILDKNESMLIDDRYNFVNDSIKKELKDIKVDIKDEKDETKSIKAEEYNVNLQIDTFYREIGLSSSDFKKKIYSFSLDF
ncbi:hypothetical protein CRU92_04020 [Arcobacter sp. FW59]|nr:hypothetical protein CRU92_04020 [Arcobacter sp. FW59]